jgi:SP family sugar:H+ symporter-like MFS transporter
MLGEMFSNRFRGAALGIAASAQWLTNFAITMTFPILLTSIGLGGAYAIYAAFSLISLAFVYYRLRETKGIELEDM